MMLSEERSGTHEAPMGTKSAYPRTSMACGGQDLTQHWHSQHWSGSWFQAFMVSLFSTIRSFGQMYWQAVLSSALHPSHFSGFTKLGIHVLQGPRGPCIVLTRAQYRAHGARGPRGRQTRE